MNQPACFRKSISTPSPLAGVSRTACLTAALQPVMAVMIKHNSLDPGTQISCGIVAQHACLLQRRTLVRFLARHHFWGTLRLADKSSSEESNKTIKELPGIS
jgi:hypothetical protein